MTEIKQICEKHGYTQAAFAHRFGIPLRTVQNWCLGIRTPPQYVVDMIKEILSAQK